MAQWGNTDDAANSVLWATTQVNLPANTDNQTALFGNTTQGAFDNNGVDMKQAVGQFGLDVTEIGVTNTSVAQYTITFAGSGYLANAAVTVGGNATANATAAAGRISAVNVVLPGNSYTSAPSVTVAAPDLLVFNGNTSVTNNTAIGAFVAYASANSILQVNDKVVYAGNTTSTPVNLVDQRTYYISFANTTGFKISDNPGSANLQFAKASGDNTTAGGATFQGEAATATAVLSGVGGGAGGAHAGWVLRTVGQGGRAGRVQYETLVAMGSLSGDAEDTVLKDA